MLQANATQGEKDLSDEHRMIAAYWDCNPFAVQDGGYLRWAQEDLSRGALAGHYRDCLRNGKRSFNESMFIHTIVAMGLMDSFMACWDEKFRSNRIRPANGYQETD